MRRLVFWFHLALGLVLSLYAAFIGATGGLLAFKDELLRLAEPALHQIEDATRTITPDVALAKARESHPGWRVLSVTFPNEEIPYWNTYLLRGPDARIVYIHPATGAVHATRDPKAGPVGALQQLHFNLLASRTGRLVNGYGALLLLALALSGIALWLLGARSLKIRWSSGGRARWLDLHQTIGVVTLLFLVGISVTGAWFTWSSAYVQFVNRFFERTKEPKLRLDPTQPPATLEALAAAAQQALPGKPIHRISVSEKADQITRVTLREGEPGEFHRVSTVLLHPRTTAVLHVTRHEQRPAGDAVLSWLSAFHFGVFGGWPVKLLWLALGFTLPLLALSGWLMWLKRVWRL